MATKDKKTILVIDDDSFLLDMYARKFSESGFEVDTASSGHEAYKKLTENTYQVAVLDIVMPDLSGIEILAQLQEEKKVDINKIIVLSNISQPQDVSKAMDLGAIGYIVKANNTPSEVVDKVMLILEGKEVTP